MNEQYSAKYKKKIVAITINQDRTLSIQYPREKKEAEITGQYLGYESLDLSQSSVVINTKNKSQGNPNKYNFKFPSADKLDDFLSQLDHNQFTFVYPPDLPISNERIQLQVVITTFNMGKQRISSVYLNFIESLPYVGAHLVIFGFQEADWGSSSETDLYHNVSSIMLKKDYENICQFQMTHQRLYVFLRSSLKNCVSDIQTRSKSTGVLGFGKNKGCLLLTFSFLGSPIAIVSSHLTANQQKISQRNESFTKIVEEFSSDFDFLKKYHHIIWIGDLNYRIDSEVENVLNLIKEKNFAQLLQHDQLKAQIRNKLAFTGFSEGIINFPPTYKFKPKQNLVYETDKRIPSWCDRILVRSFDGLFANCSEYLDANKVLLSDHVPIYAIWTLEVNKILPSPPLFSSVFKTSAIIEFKNISYIPEPNSLESNTIFSVSLNFSTPFLNSPQISGTGKGYSQINFPDECIPALIPPTILNISYLKTLFVTIQTTVSASQIGYSILPLKDVIPDQFLGFSISVEAMFKKMGNLVGQIRILSGNSNSINDVSLLHQKVGSNVTFKSKPLQV